MGHSYVSLTYHVVFSTKYRIPWITEDLEIRLHRFIAGVIRKRGGRLIAAGGVEDHLHLLVKLPQSRSVSSFVAAIKANSSRFSKEASNNAEFSWQSGYAAFTVSESQIPGVREYIENQKEHHRSADYEAELRLLAQRHGLALEDAFFARA